MPGPERILTVTDEITSGTRGMGVTVGTSVGVAVGTGVADGVGLGVGVAGVTPTKTKGVAVGVGVKVGTGVLVLTSEVSEDIWNSQAKNKVKMKKASKNNIITKLQSAIFFIIPSCVVESR